MNVQQSLPIIPPATHQPTQAPSVYVKDGNVYANSRDVAKFFEKEHKNVLRDIEVLVQAEPTIALNFEPIEISVKVGFGYRKDRAYDTTRDGFALLAMGFTGSKALEIEEQAIR